MAKTPATLEAISTKLDSLCRLVEALDQRMQQLADRLEPFESDPFFDRPHKVMRDWQFSKPEAPTLDVILDKIREADSHIEAIERDFSAVRAKLDELEREDLLREEIGRWLKPRKRRGKS